jgi:hypothetical protein
MSNANANANPTTGGPPLPAQNPTTVAGRVPPIIHSNYKEFYGDASVHPLWTPDYAPLISTMTILPANAVGGLGICHAIRDNQNVQVFMCMGLFGDPAITTSVGRIDVVHRLTYLSAPFSAAADRTIHDKLYGIVGDIMTGQQVAKVIVPSDSLDASTATLIASDQVFQAASANSTLAETYGPYPTPGVDNMVAQTRGLCFITPQVASLILGSPDRTPRGILLLLARSLAGPTFVQFAPVFLWLRVAQTLGSGIKRHPFVSAPPREEVNRLIMSNVGRDLPLMGQTPIHQVGQQLTNAVGNFTATFVAQNEAERLRRSSASQSSVMTIQKKFSFQEEPLRRLLQIPDLANAPAVWEVIASHNVKQVRQILQTALGKTCYLLHLTPPILPQAFTRIVVDPSSWRCSEGPANVLQGFSLFHVLLRPQADELARMKAAASYDLAMSTDSSLTSQDTSLFNNPGQVNTTWVEPLVAKVTLKNMWALCVTIMGDTHTVSVGLEKALRRWDQFEMVLNSKYQCSPDTWTMQILYWVHRQLSHWIDVQYHSDAPIPFSVEQLFSDITLGNHWSRGMPLEYIPARLVPAPAPSAGTTPTLVSGLTPPEAPPLAPPLAEIQVPVLQPPAQRVPQLAAYSDRRNGRRLITIIAAAATAGNDIPKDRHNQNFCLSWHVTAKCNSQCHRARNHRKLSDDEVARLGVWCELAF